MKLIDLLEDLGEMMKGQFNTVKATGGRRYIPDNIEIPVNKLMMLNQESNGPHIKLIGNRETGEKFLLVSTFLKIALDESQRGRTSRDTLMYQNKLLKRFNEIFEDSSMFKVVLKQSLQGQKIRKTPFGDMFTSKLIVLPSDGESDVIKVKNPSKSGMAGGLDEETEK